jgi:hypothetical protein
MVTAGRTTKNLGMAGQAPGSHEWDKTGPMTVRQLRGETRTLQFGIAALLGFCGFVFYKWSESEKRQYSPFRPPMYPLEPTQPDPEAPRWTREEVEKWVDDQLPYDPAEKLHEFIAKTEPTRLLQVAIFSYTLKEAKAHGLDLADAKQRRHAAQIGQAMLKKMEAGSDGDREAFINAHLTEWEQDNVRMFIQSVLAVVDAPDFSPDFKERGATMIRIGEEYAARQRERFSRVNLNAPDLPTFPGASS